MGVYILGAGTPRINRSSIAMLAALALAAGLLTLQAQGPLTEPVRSGVGVSSTQTALAMSAAGAGTLTFESNTGQTAGGADFVARGSQVSASIAASRLAVADGQTTVHMHLVGSDPHAVASTSGRRPGTTNYFLGNDASAWQSQVSSFDHVAYANVYPGIDLAYSASGGGNSLEYTFTVRPGSNPDRIELSYPGAEAVAVGRDGGLLIRTDHGMARWRIPAIYQTVGGSERDVPGRFAVQKDGRIGLAVGNFDRTLPLVIDPSVTFSTYFGGTQQETGRAIAVTPAGDIAVVGSSYSPDFPTLNPVRPTYSGIKQDLVVLRINAAGSLVYSTYLGGNGDDNPRDIVFDTAGDVYATGYGNSHDLPTMNPIQAASGGGGDDDYLFELSPTGALMYGTYLGGKGKDGKPQIALGSDNSIYLAGYSTGYFPVTAGAFQPTMHGTVDFTVTKLAPGAHSIVYSTYYGGTVNDTPRGVRVDALGNAYTTGWSESADFPVTPGAYQTTFGGDRDGTLTKFDPSGQPVWSTYIGGSGKDGPYQGDSIAIDATGNSYVTGWAQSSNFPVMNPIQGIIGGSGSTLKDAYVAKFDSNGALLFSTYYGGTSTDEGTSIALDAGGNMYVTGTATGKYWPAVNSMFPKPGAVDGYLLKISPTYQLQYASWLGGVGGDYPTGVTTDPAGNIYLTGYTTSLNFPVTNAIQSTNHGKADIFITKVAP